MQKYIFLCLSMFFLYGCTGQRAVLTGTYAERPKLESSLFSSDQQILSEDAIKQILESKIEIPSKAKIALIKFEGNDQQVSASKYYGYYFWKSEDYLKLQQQVIDTVSSELLTSNRVAEVTLLPSLLLPKNATVSVLREAGVRLQADLLLIFRLTSDIYYDYAFFGKDKVKAFSTCEFVLFDVRTGIIPFTTIITKDVLITEEKKDTNTDELMKRAEKTASMEALSTCTQELVAFLNALPE